MSMNPFAVYGKPKYKFQVVLPQHPDTLPKNDPRKVWLYDSQITSWQVVDTPGKSWNEPPGKIYSFGFEEDMMVFMLRWGGSNE